MDLKGKRGFAFDTKLESRLSGSAAKFIEKKLRERGLDIIRPHGSAIVAGQKGAKIEEVVLKEGMVFNLEPYAGKPGIGGIRLENNHIVTSDGVDIYTTYPFDERLVDDVHPLDTTTGRTR